MDLIEFIDGFDTFLAFVGIVVIVSQLVIKTIFKKMESKTGKQVLTWCIAVGLAFAGAWLNLGMFKAVHDSLTTLWHVPLIIGLAAGVAANGFYSARKILGLLRPILEFFGINILPKAKSK